jgi:hypothetical protein
MLSGDESFADISDLEAQEKIKDVILRLDSAREEISNYSVLLGTDLEQLSSSSAVSFRMLGSKLLMASRLVGARAEDLASDLDSPTVWGALSAINLKIEEVRAEANKHANSTQQADPLLANRVGRVERDLLATVTNLLEAINSLGLKVDGRPSPSASIANLTGVLSSGIAIDIQERVNKLSGEIENLRSDKKMISIKFARLGFDSPQKANAWLMANVAPSDVGLIVDPHTVLEHIYAEENGDDFC